METVLPHESSPGDMGRVGHNHVVQFYESESFLCDAVGNFLHEGAAARQPLLVIATPNRWSGFSTRLRAKGADVDACRDQGLLTVLDARDTLSTFMVENMPDERRFMAHVGSVVEGKTRLSTTGSVRAYGEMVDLLWQDGNPDGAIRLEELWNDLAMAHDLSLLCAYAMSNFHGDRDQRRFKDVCGQHARVSPADPYAGAVDDEGRAREVSLLQQRARALEIEIEYRKRLEAALRKALAERAQFEEALLAREQDLRNVLGEREQLLSSERGARAHAEQASRLKDEFLAIISHELRTPLNAIFGWAHIGSEPRADEATRRRAIEVIQRNARLQLHVVDDLLDISRIVNGKMKISAETIDLHPAIAAAVDSVRLEASAKPLTFEVRMPASPILVRGDAGRLQQVIWNLLSNAIKFTPADGRIELSLESDDQIARIVVTDTGQGIAVEFLPLVFDRFRQADASTTRRHGGLGLGLSVVRHLVEAHGGAVTVESAGVGHGATFTVSLPVARDGSGSLHVPGERGLENVRILAVEDQDDSRDLLRFVLLREGAIVETAKSVPEAKAALTAKAFDVLVADLGLPEEDGYSLIRAIRQTYPSPTREIRAVALTAYAGDYYRTKALAAGYDVYVAKPIEPSRFTEVLRGLIERTNGRETSSQSHT